MSGMDFNADHQRVRLHNVEVVLSVGIADWESLRPQKLLVSVDLYGDAPPVGTTDIEACINYNPVKEHITDVWPTRGHTNLLEELIDDLFVQIWKDNKVKAARVMIHKPQVYPDAQFSGVEVYRNRP
ncbi:MAG: hypothetical protein Alpg2KO_27530 [Alphaproteobacteria bacterium]